MDWTDPMMAMFGLNPEPSAQTDAVDDDADTFDNDAAKQNDDTQAGASVIETEQPQVQPVSSRAPSAEVKTENQRRAEELRAKLLAQRQNTPAKTASRSNTPAKPSHTPKAPVQKETKSDADANAANTHETVDIEALLSEGKKKADAQAAALAAATVGSIMQPQTNGVSQNNDDVKMEEAHAAPELAQPQHQHERIAHPTQLSDAYYADLPVWLEMTGFHNVEHREARVQHYKQTRELEQQAADIAKKLEKLRQSAPPFTYNGGVTTTNMPPPPLPQSLPVEKASPHVNGTKRAHSPERLPAEKARRREENGGFRIRGANDSPDVRPGSARRPQTPSPTELERRISYPDARRRSIDDYKGPRSRDHSLERRQAYYRTDNDRGDFNNQRYDQYIPGDAPRGPPPRSQNHNNSNRANRGPPYRGNGSLDLRKGDIRYFMIKSWNYENVAAAQRDGLWATQKKNEQILTEAFESSRHVILLFSVNKSMHFAGYALMTSPPDPSLPKPSWAKKLNWGTSAAFTLQWLATTPIGFKKVGQLKNNLVLDDDGLPRSVVIGYDGQEICEEAGRGVVRVLKEAQKEEAEKAERCREM